MKRSCALFAAAAAVAVVTLEVPGRAGSCTIAGATWCYDTGGSSMSDPIGLSSEGLSQEWAAAGGTLYAFDSGAGSLLATTSGIGTISNRPMTVKLPSGAYATFFGSNDGNVYRVDAKTGACGWKTLVGRTDSATIQAGCGGTIAALCPGDEVTGTPAVKFGADDASTLIFVGTRYTTLGSNGCGTSSTNRVYALRASDGSPVWVFNKPTSGTPYGIGAGPYNMSFVAGGVFPDVWDDGCSGTGARNNLYVGSAAKSSQSTLWSLDASSGALNWSVATGGVQTTPIMVYNNAARCGRLYVGTKSSTLNAFGITSAACGGGAVPCQLWSAVTTGGITLNPALMQYGANKGSLFVTDGNLLEKWTDNGASASTACTYTGAGTTLSSPVMIDSYVYVGDNKGNLNEVSQATCLGAASLLLGASTMVGDAGIDADPTFTTPFVVIGNSAGRIARFNIPF